MSGVEMVREIRGLSGSCVARLAGSALYAAVDAYVDRWCLWVLDQSKAWDTWQDCHQAYLSAS